MVVAAVIAAGLLATNAAPAAARTPRLKKPSAPTDLVVTPTDGGGTFLVATQFRRRLDDHGIHGHGWT
jgi:hypothetical protein